jgi:hypothetical protein
VKNEIRFVLLAFSGFLVAICVGLVVGKQHDLVPALSMITTWMFGGAVAPWEKEERK